MAEPRRTEAKNFIQDRPGGYFTPKGIDRQAERHDRDALAQHVRLLGDTVPSPLPRLVTGDATIAPRYRADGPETSLYVGDCREILAKLPERGNVDLVFADPPFNWDVPYTGWKDGMPRAEFERFTFDWLDLAVDCLAPHGSIWVNVPDDLAAEVVMHLKRRKLAMMNWCVWHFRFGHNRDTSFILSKSHALWFAKDPENTRWNGDAVLEPTDRSTMYGDNRTHTKLHGSQGMRVPFDVWYGPYWGARPLEELRASPAAPEPTARGLPRARDPLDLAAGRPRARSVRRLGHDLDGGARVGPPQHLLRDQR